MFVEDIRVKGAEEETGSGALVGDLDASGIAGTGKVRLDDPQRAPWRRIVGFPIERQPNLGGALVHVNGDHGRDDAGEKWDQLARKLPENGSRILFPGQRLEHVERRRQLDVARLHRLEEELLLRLDVAEERGGRDVQLARDVGQRRRLEALPGEDAAGRGEQLGPLDGCRASHL